EQRKMLVELVELMGVKELSARTDRLEQSFSFLETKLTELIESHNTLLTNLKQSQPPQQGITPTTQIEKIQLIGELIKGLEPVINRVWPINNPQQSIIDQDYINEKVKASVMGNFEVGEALIENLKTKIIGKAMGKVVTGIVT